MKLEVCKIGFSYPNGQEIFDNVSFSLEKGEIFTILGPNGAGKSTLLNCLANLNALTRGQISLGDRDMRKISLKEIAQKISYVPQIHQPTYGFTVEEFVSMGRTPYLSTFKKLGDGDRQIINGALDLVNINHLREKPYTEISGGERQLVTIARALAQEPDFILLDEPTAHLDFGNQIKMMKLIKMLSVKGYGIIMTTHNPDQVLYIGGRVGILDQQGKFKTGHSHDQLTGEVLSDLYKEPVRIFFSQELNRHVCISGI